MLPGRSEDKKFFGHAKERLQEITAQSRNKRNFGNVMKQKEQVKKWWKVGGFTFVYIAPAKTVQIL